jgi:thymidylate synthase
MFISQETLDDLLREVFRKILNAGTHVKPSKGWNRELSGVLLELRQPTARLSRTETKGTVFSTLGESLWYLAKTNKLDFIAYYIPRYRKFSDDGRTLYGAYGPRLFAMRGGVNQIRNVVNLLKRKPNSRQAVSYPSIPHFHLFGKPLGRVGMRTELRSDIQPSMFE